MPAQPEGVRGVGADGETGGRISPQAPYPSSLAKCAVCRQTPKVGAECGNPARSDLCGGTGVTRFPTAINRSIACAANSATHAPSRSGLLLGVAFSLQPLTERHDDAVCGLKIRDLQPL